MEDEPTADLILSKIADGEFNRLIKAGKTLAEMGQHFQCSDWTVGKELRGRGIEYDHRATGKRNREASDIHRQLDEKFEELLTYRERQILKSDVLEKAWAGTYMMLVMSDWHGFLVRDDMVRLAVKQAMKDKPKKWPLRVVIAGDIMDLRLFSRFLDYDWQCDPKFQTKQEIEKIESLFQHLILKTDRVMAIAGNHDWRAYKDLVRRMDKDKAEILLANQPILGWVMGHINGIDVAPAFYQRFGDVVVGHSEDFSQIPMRTGTNFVDWLNIWIDDSHNINCVCTGHSHHFGMCWYHRKIVIETGCMCKPADYLYSGKLGAGKKERWYNGYVTIPMENNKAKLNDIRLVELDEL